MKPVNNHKYLVSSEKDQTWGITVDTVGSESVAAGYETYPPRVGHPSGFYFDVGKGRVLESYQLLYITSGRGSFYGPDRKRIGIGAGDMVLLRPNRWHSYMPDRETGWHEYWIGFRGPNIDARFRNDFFDDSREVFRVGVREEITALYDKAIEVAENERSSYQQYLAGIANLLDHPEYQSLDKAQPLMSFLSDEELSLLPIQQVEEGASILIGPENVAEELKDSSVVMASYDLGDGMKGLIGVVGPTRMDYAKISARLNYFARGLSNLMGQRELPSAGPEDKSS